jgi:hypothetical protein
MYASAVSVIMPDIPGLLNVVDTGATVLATMESASAGQVVLANVCSDAIVSGVRFPALGPALPMAFINGVNNAVELYALTLAVKFATIM